MVINRFGTSLSMLRSHSFTINLKNVRKQVKAARIIVNFESLTSKVQKILSMENIAFIRQIHEPLTLKYLVMKTKLFLRDTHQQSDLKTWLFQSTVNCL